MIRLAAIAALLASALAAALGAELAPPLPPERELSAEVERQRLELERQAALLSAQEEQIRRLEALVGELRSTLDSRLAASQAAERTALENRLDRLEQSFERLPESGEEIVRAGDTPGAIALPGTDSTIEIGGQVRTSAVVNVDALGVDDRFATSAIPVEPVSEPDAEGHVNLSPSGSRVHFDFRAPTAVGPVRAFIEADFQGSGNTLRLRHAFGRWHDVLIGQTWSTFSDPEAEPDGIDFEGLNAISLFRQVQVRWSRRVGERTRLALALEDPHCSVSGGDCLDRSPDLVARWRWEQLHRGDRAGHVQAALLARRLSAVPLLEGGDVGERASATGYGVTTSASFLLVRGDGNDRLRWALYAGRGIGSYLTDLDTEGGQDAVFDPESGELRPLDVLAAYVGYEHAWRPGLRSTLTYGVVAVDNLDIQGPDAYRRTRRVSLNLAWSPVPRLDLVAELLAGERKNKDGREGEATQLQLGTRFLF